MAATTASTIRAPTNAMPAGTMPATSVSSASAIVSGRLVAQTSSSACRVYWNTSGNARSVARLPCELVGAGFSRRPLAMGLRWYWMDGRA